MAESASMGFKSLITVISAILLVGMEFFCLAIAAGWAIAGLLELGNIFEYIFMAAFSLLALWGTMRFARSAWKLEWQHRHH